MDKDKEAGLYGLVSGAGLFLPGEGQAKYYRMAEEKLGLLKTQIKLGILKQELKQRVSEREGVQAPALP